MKDIKITVGKNIIALRQMHGITQLELAERLNYSDKAVSKWERGESTPDISVLVDIAEIFGVTVDYLVRDKHDKDERSQNEMRLSPADYKHHVITAVSISLVWFIDIVILVLISIIGNSPKYQWLVAVYAVPVSAIVWLVLNSVWFNPRRNYFIVSILMWSLLATVHLSLLPFSINIWQLYIIGVPGEIIIFLCSCIKKRPKINIGINSQEPLK